MQSLDLRGRRGPTVGARATLEAVGPVEVVLLHLVLKARALQAERAGGLGLVPLALLERLLDDLGLDPLDLLLETGGLVVLLVRRLRAFAAADLGGEIERGDQVGVG